ncbi:MAG: hydroxyethylthiazole kinase [Desulfurococcaceae archaeon]
MDWLGESLDRVRARRPLVHNITNFVVMNTTANALLALGASPIMSHSIEDIEDLVPAADAVVLNIGTLDEYFVYSMLKAAQIARRHGKPVVLDPVGAGATRLRTEAALMILRSGGVTIVRGNFGEVSALLGERGKTRGVETATFDKERAAELALAAASKFGVVAAVTGPVDHASDGRRVYRVELARHSPSLEGVIKRVTGLGCVVTALIGAFAAVEEPLKAAIAGLAVFRAASLYAAEEAPYPGSFQVKLYDWLYRLGGSDVVGAVRVSRVGP